MIYGVGCVTAVELDDMCVGEPQRKQELMEAVGQFLSFWLNTGLVVGSAFGTLLTTFIQGSSGA